MSTTRKQLTEQVVVPTLEEIKSLFSSKGDEYAISGAFHNFVQATKQSRTPITPIQALEGMKLKHDVSINDILNQADKDFRFLLQGGKRSTKPSKEKIDEKWNDALTYMILLKGFLYELYDYYEDEIQQRER